MTNHDELPSCCKWRGLSWPDGGKRCYRHASDEDRRLQAALDVRGRALGLRSNPEYGLLWPYGPNIDMGARQRMVEWAEAHHLRVSHSHYRCLHWLRRGRCAARCPGYRSHWMDHVTAWNQGGKPAVLVAQPYGLTDEDRDELARLDQEPGLRVETREDSWYGYSTTFVGVWRES